MVDQFHFFPPQEFVQKYPGMGEWCRQVTLLLDDITREDGLASTVTTTEETVLTHGEKVDLITVTQSVNLDTIESDTAANKSAIEAVRTSSPTYTITNDGTDRSLNADAAAGAITNPPTQAEVENIRDAVLDHADTLATLIRDLANKGILGD